MTSGHGPPQGHDEAVRRVLLADRAGTQARAVALGRDLGGIIDATADSNSDDEHDPEGSTIAFERAQVLALLDGASARLAEIDEALGRLDDGSYGRCAACAGPIAPARLAARPSATLCIACASRPRGR